MKTGDTINQYSLEACETCTRLEPTQDPIAGECEFQSGTEISSCYSCAKYKRKDSNV